ncbi:MAG: transposase [Spirochaetia bacterium]|jgi:IS5 family transposase|nr:transposase [Spirochaetia bacterium]
MDSTPNRLSLQPLLFDRQDLCGCFFLEPTPKEVEFLRYWQALVALVPTRLSRPAGGRTGRRGYSLTDILAVRAVLLFFRLDTVTAAVALLQSSPNLRTVTQLGRVPSPSSVSRRTARLLEEMDFRGIHDRLCRQFYAGRTVCHLSLDSTPVDARERPAVRTKRQKGRRGRPKAGSAGEKAVQERKGQEARLVQLRDSGDPHAYLATLEQRCTVTGKRNSRGHMQWRVGYKVHLAVDDSGIPVASAVTGACVHDTQPAIPLLRIAAGRCTWLYALMDGGYSSGAVRDRVLAMGRVPLIDFKADRNGAKEEMDPAGRARYRARTTVERTNSELKECFLPKALYGRGPRARFDLRLAVLLLTVKRMGKVLEARQQAARKKSA